MKKQIFEKFRAKSLDKESQKSVVGGDWYSCVGQCMVAEFAYFNAHCGGGWEPSMYMYGICQPECYANPNRTSWTLKCL